MKRLVCFLWLLQLFPVQAEKFSDQVEWCGIMGQVALISGQLKKNKQTPTQVLAQILANPQFKMNEEINTYWQTQLRMVLADVYRSHRSPAKHQQVWELRCLDPLGGESPVMPIQAE
jgi:hypothetical protein